MSTSHVTQREKKQFTCPVLKTLPLTQPKKGASGMNLLRGGTEEDIDVCCGKHKQETRDPIGKQQ